jgi:DNA polymerase III alpha subunit
MIKFTNCSCEVEKGKFSINDIPLDCSAVWRLIASGHTVGVFQLEKKLGQDWAQKVKPDSIEELAALTALIRPGPLVAGLSQVYVNIKFGREKATYLHPALQPILEPTHSVMCYQEQSLQIATSLAGFDPVEADTLRSAIGKKLADKMASLKDKFVIGCQKHSNINNEIAEEIFNWIEKCQRYQFNKSHAISYGMIAYQTAWVKCHFPQEFFTSYLTFSSYKTDPKTEIFNLVQDARLFGVDILPPDIRRSNIHFQMTEKPKKGVAFGLAHIRGVGASAIQKIVSASKETLGTWADFLGSVPDFHRNVGIALIKSGACDCYGMERNEMVRELEVVLGTTVHDADGKKVEVKGLTSKEKVYFFEQLQQEIMTTQEILVQMAQPVGTKIKNIKQMDKKELIKAAKEYLDQADSAFDGIVDGDSRVVYTSVDEKNIWLETIEKRTKKAIEELILQNGYKDTIVKPPCANDARRNVMITKAAMLEEPLKDTNIANAIAEKHFLGIALSCSQADDADHTLATHSCLEIAKAPNEEEIVVCAIIDSVKHTITKRGKNPGQRMCFLTISDSTYSIDHAVVFPDAFNRLKAFCKDDIICLIYGQKKNGSFIIRDIQKLI